MHNNLLTILFSIKEALDIYKSESEKIGFDWLDDPEFLPSIEIRHLYNFWKLVVVKYRTKLPY